MTMENVNRLGERTYVGTDIIGRTIAGIHERYGGLRARHATAHPGSRLLEGEIIITFEDGSWTYLKARGPGECGGGEMIIPSFRYFYMGGSWLVETGTITQEQFDEAEAEDNRLSDAENEVRLRERYEELKKRFG